jgi:hypothetical protein
VTHVFCFELAPKPDEIIPEAEHGERVRVPRRAAQAEQLRKNIIFASQAANIYVAASASGSGQ